MFKTYPPLVKNLLRTSRTFRLISVAFYTTLKNPSWHFLVLSLKLISRFINSKRTWEMKKPKLAQVLSSFCSLVVLNSKNGCIGGVLLNPFFFTEIIVECLMVGVGEEQSGSSRLALQTWPFRMPVDSSFLLCSWSSLGEWKTCFRIRDWKRLGFFSMGGENQRQYEYLRNKYKTRKRTIELKGSVCIWKKNGLKLTGNQRKAFWFLWGSGTAWKWSSGFRKRTAAFKVELNTFMKRII